MIIVYNHNKGTIVTKKRMSLIFRGKEWARYIISLAEEIF